MVECGRSWKKLLEFFPGLGQCSVLWLAMRSAPSIKALVTIQQRLYLCAVQCSLVALMGHADVGRASPGSVWGCYVCASVPKPLRLMFCWAVVQNVCIQHINRPFSSLPREGMKVVRDQQSDLNHSEIILTK